MNAVHAFYLGEDVDTEHPDHYITQHSSTGADTPHYMHSTRLWTYGGIGNYRGGRKNRVSPHSWETIFIYQTKLFHLGQA